MCEGYELKLSFDVDDSRNSPHIKINAKGETVHGFRGRPRLKESLMKRDKMKKEHVDTSSVSDYPITSTQKTHMTLSTSDSSTISKADDSVPMLLTDSETISTPGESSKKNIVDEFHTFQDLFPSFVRDEEIPSFINNIQESGFMTSNNNRDALPPTDSKMSDIDENLMLKHFFKRLLPLLDAHPSSPWPQLALKYCDFEIAKSCFIALACIHLYETKGAQEFYRTGMVYVNNTLEYLIDYLKGKSEDSEGDEDTLDVPKIISNLKKQPIEKQRSNFFVILLLIHVHFLFSVVESGRSALVRSFSELFSAIVKDVSFKSYLQQIEESSTLIANLSWFDTISAVVSPDCRLPYCDESWYGTKDTPKSTIRLMGCPGEIMRTISRFCRLRREVKENYRVIDLNIENKFNALKFDLLKYRDYVIFRDDMSDLEYDMTLKCAQCWALAVLINLYRLVKPDDKQTMRSLTNEFIAVYSSMETSSPQITQMIWPIFTVACVCTTEYQKVKVEKLLDNLHSTINMGTISSIKAISKTCWETGTTWEEILDGKEWFASGIDFLVV